MDLAALRRKWKLEKQQAEQELKLNVFDFDELGKLFDEQKLLK